MIIASNSPVAILLQNFFLFFVSKSFLVATKIFALGYKSKNSDANCSIMWFGTTKRDLLHKPNLFDSIALATIS